MISVLSIADESRAAFVSRILRQLPFYIPPIFVVNIINFFFLLLLMYAYETVSVILRSILLGPVRVSDVRPNGTCAGQLEGVCLGMSSYVQP